jgi:LysM repeat protein
MNFSRQTLLGLAMMVGGGVVLFAMVQQVGTSNQANAPEPTAIEQSASAASENGQPLTTDVATEERILAQKQKEREARVAQQERRTKEFLAEQEQAEANALAKARAENEQYMNNNAVEPVGDDTSPEVAASIIAKPTVQNRTDTTATTTQTPAATTATVANTANDEAKKTAAREAAAQKAKLAEQKAAADKQAQQRAAEQAKAKQNEQAKAQQAAADKKKADELKAEQKKAEQKQAEQKKAEAAKAAPKTPGSYEVKRGDGLIRLAREYNVPVEALAQANNMSTSDSLRVGQELKIPSKSQISRLEREAAEEKRRAEAAKTAQQRLAQARQEAARGEAKGSFGVQVALADNQAKADEVAKKLRSAGYKVSTSPTSRGVRVIVGPETGKPAALALKDKINGDSRTGIKNAWVLYWR